MGNNSSGHNPMPCIDNCNRGDFQVYVDHGHRTLQLTVHGEDTVFSLKKKIEKQMGLPVSVQTLTIRPNYSQEIQLDGFNKLNDYGIQHGSTIQVTEKHLI